jgi:Concanavalin A-like lectin/glucanases superfamily/PA14 domain
MKKIVFLLLFSISAIGQIMSTYYPTFESNRGKGNKYLFYRLYSTSSSTFPASAAEFEANFTTPANFKLAGYVPLSSNAGGLNSSSSYSANLINFLSQIDLKNAINNQTPYSGFTGDGFTIVVSGYFIPKQTGTYTFTIEGDDAVDLFINDQNVVNHYGAHGYSAIGTHTGTISLIAGKKYLFRARMQEGAGGEVMQLFWKKPSESSSSTWYQDMEELSGEEVVPNSLVFNVDPGNFYSYPKNGTSVSDLKGNATGTIGGNMVFSNTAGGAFSLDGNGDYIDFGKTPTNFPTGDISVFAWIRPTSLTNGWNIFMSKWFTDFAGNGGYSDFHYAIYPNGGIYYQNLYTATQYNLFGATAISTNTWYQVGFTIGGGYMQMYINGTTDGALRANSRTNYTQSHFWLGDGRVGAGGLIGNLGSVFIYNRVITADEVLQNYNATKHKYGL